MKYRLIHLARTHILGALLFSSLFIASSMGTAAAKGQKYALLVGVNDYTKNKNLKSLRGPRNDIVLMYQTLQNYGFKADNITVLSDLVPSKNSSNSEPRLVVPELDAKAGLPTQANIMKAMNNLATKATKDDLVMFYFSGHGSFIPDIKNDRDDDDERDAYDEVFLPIDAGNLDDGPDLRVITDDDINAVLKSNRTGAFFWLVFDSCHSGDMTRGIGVTPRAVSPSALGIKLDTNSKKIRSIKTRGGGSAVKLIKSDNYQWVQPGTKASSNTSNIIAFSAAPSDQQAIERKIGGRSHGVFTYALHQVLATKRPRTYQQLADMIRASINTMKGEAPPPVFEAVQGAMAHPFLSNTIDGQLSWSAIVETSDAGIHYVNLPNVGLLQGINEGTIFGLYSPDKLDEKSADKQQEAIPRPLGYVEVTRVGLSASQAKAIPFEDGAPIDLSLFEGRTMSAIVRRTVVFATNIILPDWQKTGDDRAARTARSAIKRMVERTKNKQGLPVNWITPKAAADDEEGDITLQYEAGRLYFLKGIGELVTLADFNKRGKMRPLPSPSIKIASPRSGLAGPTDEHRKQTVSLAEDALWSLLKVRNLLRVASSLEQPQFVGKMEKGILKLAGAGRLQNLRVGTLLKVFNYGNEDNALGQTQMPDTNIGVVKIIRAGLVTSEAVPSADDNGTIFNAALFEGKHLLATRSNALTDSLEISVELFKGGLKNGQRPSSEEGVVCDQIPPDSPPEGKTVTIHSDKPGEGQAMNRPFVVTHCDLIYVNIENAHEDETKRFDLTVLTMDVSGNVQAKTLKPKLHQDQSLSAWLQVGIVTWCGKQQCNGEGGTPQPGLLPVGTERLMLIAVERPRDASDVASFSYLQMKGVDRGVSGVSTRGMQADPKLASFNNLLRAAALGGKKSRGGIGQQIDFDRAIIKTFSWNLVAPSRLSEPAVKPKKVKLASQKMEELTFEIYPPAEIEEINRERNQNKRLGLDGRTRGIASALLLWRPDRFNETARIRVCFVDGAPKVRRKIVAIAREWTVIKGSYVPIDFINESDPPTCKNGELNHIRIGTKAPVASWSLVGMRSKNNGKKANKPSMNIKDAANLMKASPREFRRVVLHEFGHALGLRHEHQHPEANCAKHFKWKAIYKRLHPPLKKGQIRKNFRTLSRKGKIVRSEQVDNSSVMFYALPKNFFKKSGLDKCYVTPNYQLSQIDKQMIISLYPVNKDERAEKFADRRKNIYAIVKKKSRGLGADRKKGMDDLADLLGPQ